MIERLREKSPLPEGAIPVAVGLAVNGAAIYVFLPLLANVLTATDDASLTVMWGPMFAVGNGVMQPLEQEIARAVSARRALGIGPGPVIRRAAAIGASFTAVFCVIVVITHAWVLDRLLDGNVG